MSKLNELIPSSCFPEFKGVPCRGCGVEYHGLTLGELCPGCAVADREAREASARRDYINTPEGQRRQGVPEQYFFARFADFPEHHDKLARWFARGRGVLLIWGGCGTGKTRALYAIRRLCFANGVDEAGGSCAQMVRELTSSPKTSGGKFVKLAFHRGVVIIDDIGASKMSEYASGLIEELIDIRQTRGLPTALVSNLDLNGLSKVLGERAVSRLASAALLHFTGEDKRVKEAA